MTPAPDAPEPSENPTETTSTSRRERKAAKGKLSKKLVAAITAGVVVVVAAGVSIALVVSPALSETAALPTTVQSATAAPKSSSAAPAPKTFAPFDRAEYVQLPVSASATGTVKPTTITVSASDTGKIMPEGLAGLSLDTDHLSDLELDPSKSNLGSLLKMANNPVIRFGAQSVDRRFFWTSTDEPIPNWTLVPGYKGDVRKIIKVTPTVLQNLRTILDEGNARVLMAVDMGHFDPARAADFAKYAHQILGDRLVGISLGNEPNGYNRTETPYYTLRPPSYTFEDWAKEAREVSAAIAVAAPGVKIVGPQVYSEAWLKKFAALKIPNAGAISFHNYPLNECWSGPADPRSRTINNALSRDLADASSQYAAAAVSAAEGTDLPVWNSETNVSSCPGPSELSNTQAQAQWTVNFSLLSATAGVTQVNFHGSLEACKGGPPLSPLCDTGGYKNPNGIAAARAQYYGIAFVNKLGAGKFQDVKVDGDQNVYAYPVKHKDGTMSVMVVNQNDPGKTAPASITLKLPAQSATGVMTQLAAPELASFGETRIDGQEDAGVALATQARIPGYAAGAQTVTVALNSGTSTILNFTF